MIADRKHLGAMFDAHTAAEFETRLPSNTLIPRG